MRWTSLLCILFLVEAAPVGAASTPSEPHGPLVDEVAAFLMADVGTGGIRTEDDDPQGDPVPPYFYHFSIRHDDGLESSTGGYPGFASISYPGYTAAIGIDAFLAYWAYSGNTEALARARQYADWLLPRRTPATDLYGNMVYSTQTDGVMGGGFDGDAIMTDKPAMFALRCLRLFDITGHAPYFDAAVEIADSYVATQWTGGPEDAGRWPFRVRPSDGAVRQDYGSHLAPMIRFLEAMEARVGGQGYGAAAAAAWAWLWANPMNPASPSYQRWEGFYEDIDAVASAGLRDHYSAENAIESLLDRGDPGDLAAAVDIYDWSTNRYLAPDGTQNGFGFYHPALLEWDAWPNTTYAAAGQWAWVTLRLDQAAQGDPLHDPNWRSDAIEALHNLTYGQGDGSQPPTDGRMLTTIRALTNPNFGIDTWYEQNFNTVKYMLLSFGLAPELAPANEEHLLRFEGSELTFVDYQPESVTTRWSGGGKLWLKARSKPLGVRVGSAWFANDVADLDAVSVGWSWDASTNVCVVKHGGEEVEVVITSATSAPSTRALILGRPHPQPASGATSLSLLLPAAAPVTAAIHDVRGRRVAVVQSQPLPAGRHLLRWDGLDDGGRPVASGVYRWITTVDGQRHTRRVTLVR